RRHTIFSRDWSSDVCSSDLYSQVHRLGVYNEALEQLKEAKRLFACDCSRRKISRESKDGSYPGTCKKKNVPFDAEGTSWRLHTRSEERRGGKAGGGGAATGH